MKKERPLSHSEVKAIFRDKFNGQPNIMTPEPLQYGQRGKYWYELARGRGIADTGYIFGVTVLKREIHEIRHCHDLCQCFPNEVQAREFIQSLRTK